jgi:hypothetical protein
VFVPATNFNGDVTITFTVTDDDGAVSAPADEVITVNDVNDPPVIIDPANPGTPTNPTPAGDPLNIIPDVSTTDSTTPTPVNVGNYVVDPEGDPLTFTATGLPPGMTIDPTTGIISGTLPPDASQGGPYTVTVTATDPDGEQVITTVTYTVGNPPPVATDDITTVIEGRSVTIAALTNDYDVDGDSLSIVSATSADGTVTINPDGTISFAPTPGFLGVSEIVYTISDGNGGTATARILVTVVPQDFVPLSPTPTPVIGGPLTPVTTITVDGIVLDAVNQFGSGTGSPTGLATEGIVLAAANGVRNLQGLGTVGDAPGSIAREIARIQRLGDFDFNFGSTNDNASFDVQGITGFSLRFTMAQDGTASLTGGQLILETLVRDHYLIVQMSNTFDQIGKRVVDYRVMQADGRPLPAWLDNTGQGTLIGRNPVDIEMIKLRVVAVLDDGSTVVREVEIQTSTGEIQPLAAGRQTMLAPTFRQQLQSIPQLTPDQTEGLATAIGR